MWHACNDGHRQAASGSGWGIDAPSHLPIPSHNRIAAETGRPASLRKINLGFTFSIRRLLGTGAQPLTDATTYLSTHHLPNWYPALAEFTPETRIFPVTADLVAELHALDWPAYFIKDYVKSLKTSIGSLISIPEQAATVSAEMRRFRGTIEGGFCVRRVERFLPDTEQRYFVLDSVPHPASGAVPSIVSECVARIRSRFFSVDVVQRIDGVLRIVEIGDGQVSDLVGWTPEQFVSIFDPAVNRAGIT